MTLYCNYCKEAIENKKKDSRICDGKRYHLSCVRKLRKELDKMKMNGKLKPGKENEVQVEGIRNED